MTELPVIALQYRCHVVHALGDATVPCLVAILCHERSEEHTSELQSQSNLVCRLLLEKNKPSPPPQHTRTSRRSPGDPKPPAGRTLQRSQTARVGSAPALRPRPVHELRSGEAHRHVAH